MTAIRSTGIFARAMFIVKVLWAVVAQLLSLAALLLLPMFVFGAIAVRVVKADLVPGAILAALVGWSMVLVKLAESTSRTAAALKSAHRRFVYPFGKV